MPYEKTANAIGMGFIRAAIIEHSVGICLLNKPQNSRAICEDLTGSNDYKGRETPRGQVRANLFLQIF
jgi:hypothetical protein